MLSTSGCRRKPTEPGIYDVIEGNWNWVYSFGGYAGQYIYPDSVGYHRTIHFGFNHMYLEMIDDSTAYNEPFEIVKKAVGNDLEYVVQIENYPNELVVDRIDADTLVLSERCFDCFAHTYIRMYPIY
jgi:hypothetical protein